MSGVETHSAYRAFVDTLPEGARSSLLGDSENALWFARALDDARAAWPQFALPDDEFARHLASKVGSLPPPWAYQQLRTNDLYLACACVQKDSRAVAAFEQSYFPAIERALVRVRIADMHQDEIRDSLRETLLLGRAGGAPLIADYAGRGDLGAWLRSISIHAALKARKNDERNVEADEALDVLAASDDPELEYLRTRYAERFKDALVSALAALSPRQRNLLRQHYIDGLSLEAVAGLYRVHRATAARWLADAREAVLLQSRETLRAQGALTDSELESLVRMAQSGLHLSISRLLPPQA